MKYNVRDIFHTLAGYILHVGVDWVIMNRLECLRNNAIAVLIQVTHMIEEVY